jgi:hypothetical protein
MDDGFFLLRTSPAGRPSAWLTRIKEGEPRSPTASVAPHCLLSTTQSSMDFFATLFSIAPSVPEPEPTPSAPIDADRGGSGGTGGCIVA